MQGIINLICEFCYIECYYRVVHIYILYGFGSTSHPCGRDLRGGGERGREAEGGDSCRVLTSDVCIDVVDMSCVCMYVCMYL